MKKLLLHFVLLVALIAATTAMAAKPVHAQRARGVLCDGNTYLWTHITDLGAPARTSGVITYWYSAGTKQTGSIISSYPNVSDYKLGVQIQHYKINATTMKLLITVEGQLAGERILAQSNDALPYDLLWHWVAVAWDSNLGIVTYWLDGVTKGLTYLTNTGVPFSTVFDGSGWAICADRALTGGAPADFYSGALAEMYGHIQDNDYAYVTTPGISNIRPNAIKSNTLAPPKPLYMGVGCRWMFGDVPASNLATICQTGDHLQFPFNQWSTFSAPLGVLMDSLTSPWDLYP